MINYVNPITPKCRLLSGCMSETELQARLDARIPITYFQNTLSGAAYDALIRSVGEKIPGVTLKYITIGSLNRLGMDIILNSKGKPSEKLAKEIFKNLLGISCASWSDVEEWIRPNKNSEPIKKSPVELAREYVEFRNSPEYAELIKTLAPIGTVAMRKLMAYNIWSDSKHYRT